MKKLILILGLLLLVGNASAQDEGAGYDLIDALMDTTGEPLETINEIAPKHLPGSGNDATRAISKMSKRGGGDVTTYIQLIATALTGIAASVAVLFIIQNSFNLLTSAGGSEAVTKSKKGLMWSIIGLVVIMGSYIVVKTIISLTYSGETASLFSHQFFT